MFDKLLSRERIPDLEMRGALSAGIRAHTAFFMESTQVKLHHTELRLARHFFPWESPRFFIKAFFSQEIWKLKPIQWVSCLLSLLGSRCNWGNYHFTPAGFNDTLKMPISNHFVALLITVLMMAFLLRGDWISAMLEPGFTWCTHKAKPRNCQNKRDIKLEAVFHLYEINTQSILILVLQGTRLP